MVNELFVDTLVAGMSVPKMFQQKYPELWFGGKVDNVISFPWRAWPLGDPKAERDSEVCQVHVQVLDRAINPSSWENCLLIAPHQANPALIDWYRLAASFLEFGAFTKYWIFKALLTSQTPLKPAWGGGITLDLSRKGKGNEGKAVRV